MFEIIRYTPSHKEEWNRFVRQSKNGTFLLERDFMDYHSDRFTDCSLMFYLKGSLYAVLPANVKGATLYSHQGLTYGGLIMSTHCVAANILCLFQEMNQWLRSCGVNEVIYKPIPHIYSSQPSEEDLYALFRCGATLQARGISTTVTLSNPLKWRETRKQSLKKALLAGVKVGRSEDFASFWPILTGNLQAAHNVKPVHTLSEIQLLHSRFPESIILLSASDSEGEVLGGVVLFITGKVIHSQYISASERGKKLGAIDAIMSEVLKMQADYFDFGISTEDGGNYLNESLIFQKEGFGGRGTCYDTYIYII